MARPFGRGKGRRAPEAAPRRQWLSLKALVSAAGGAKHKDLTPFSIVVNGEEVKQGEVT
jgi:hypothetical protein